MENKIKVKLSFYGIVSAISYIYLILQSSPSISVPIFTIIQLISIIYVVRNRQEVKNKNGLLMFIPIFILSLNCFISGSQIWRFTNYILTIILYVTMILIIRNELSIDKNSFEFLFDIFINIFAPFKNFSVPFKWYPSDNKNIALEKLKLKRILLGILISMPCVIFLLKILSSADMIFLERVSSLSVWVNKFLNLEYIFKLIFGIFAGFYLFGLLYIVFSSSETIKFSKIINKVDDLIPKKQISGDIIIFNILFFSILTVYTFFMIIQFKYLFAGAELPYGLNYSEYARRGFFELVFLSILNIGLILITVFLLKEKMYNDKTKWSQLTKIFLLYLCILTTVLLISSFYRMMLYNRVYGFTRLRILVYLFLIFEAVGLLVTFKFILRPSFNIIIVYLSIGLIYYLTLNVIQIDYLIAKNNIDMYFKSEIENIDVDYLMSLSIDAAPQIIRLYNNENVDIVTKYKSKTYFENINSIYNNENETQWQNYNMSIERTKKLLIQNSDKLHFN